MGCAGIREEGSMSQWYVASQDVRTQSHTDQTLVAALQAQTQTLASSIIQGKHLGIISYVVNWGVLRGIAHKRTVRPRCGRDPPSVSLP